ncbi:MAG: glutathione S-transferase family protein [Alphaproteobacteria bacterium]|nr:glutathione S-transferase family protein [Alphaproteobacteria bacterium]
MQLHLHPMSGCSRRVLAFVRTQGIPVELVHVALEKGEQKSPAYLALNPNGRVPTLVDGDFVLWESAAILRYLAELHAPNALGRDARQRADVSRWSSWGLAHLGTALGRLNAATGLTVMRGGTPDPEEVAAARADVEQQLAILAPAVTESFVAGPEPTIADFVLAGALESSQVIARLELEGPVASWLDRLRQLDGWPALGGH